jgi:hypothetical protein
MTLADGLTLFADDEGPDWKRTLELEERGQKMVGLAEQFRDCPDAAAQQFAYQLLIDIEAWKSMCMRERMVNAVQNPPAFVCAAFYRAVIGKTDVAKIRAIMGLKGFGASVDEETGRGAVFDRHELDLLQRGGVEVVKLDSQPSSRHCLYDIRSTSSAVWVALVCAPRHLALRGFPVLTSAR